MDEERAIPNQIVFATLGWLSMRQTVIYRLCEMAN
jgi:hypothetical protein